MAETYKKITYDSKKVQVESAIRDGNGAVISTNYSKTNHTHTGISRSDSDSDGSRLSQVSCTTNKSTNNNVTALNSNVEMRVATTSAANNVYGTYVNVGASTVVADNTPLLRVEKYYTPDGGAQSVTSLLSIFNDGHVTSYLSGSVASGDNYLVKGGAVYTALTNGTVTKVGTATVGGALKPMYLNAGVPTAGTQLYSKNININGTNQAVIRSTNADVGTIYAPTTAGTSGQVVKSNGSGAPTWLTLGAASGKGVDTSFDLTSTSTNVPTTAAVVAAIKDNYKTTDAMIFKGTVNANSDLPATHYQGWTYKVATAGTYIGVACEVGDMIICITDGTSANNAHWTVIQTNIDGAVTGPASATADRFASFNGTTGKIIKDSGYSASSFAPAFTVETTGSGNAVTAVSYANNKITATKGATYNNYTHPTPTRTNTTSTASPAHGGTFTVIDSVSSDTNGHITGANTKTITLPAQYSHPNSGVTAGTYHEVTVNAQGHVTAGSNPTTHTMTQVGGVSKSYELQATGYKTILQMTNAAAYWTTCGGKSYIKALIEVSVTAPGTAAAADTKKGVWIVTCVYAGNEQNATIDSINDAAGTGNGSLRYFATFVPKTTSYCPQIAVALDNANTKVYITVTILSSTPGWQCPDSIGGDPGTTNYTRSYWEVGRYNYNWSGSKLAASITGSCDGIAGSTWDSLRNDRYIFGESAVAGSIMAQASDGHMYKLRNGANKEFTLPLHLGRCTGTFTYNGSVSPPTLTDYAQIMWETRAIAYAELTNTTMQTTAFTVPTLTSSDFGKTLYITGSLSNGCFKPDGNIVLAMVNGKTNIPIGRIDRANVALNTVPTQFTITGYSQNAYTLDSNGILTHIDGKQIKDTTYSSQAAASGGTAVSLVTTDEKYTWNNKSNLAIGTTATTAAAGNHTHTTSLATDTGTATVTLAHNTTYKLTAGGTSVIFKTPTDNNTDTKVTSVGNHYAPEEDSEAELTASASGATAAWSIDVVKGVTISRDAKGHVTGVSVTSGKIPANPNTDTKTRQTLQTGNYNLPLLMSYVRTSDTTANRDGVSYRNNSIYANPSTGSVYATHLYKGTTEVVPVSFSRSLTSGTKIGTITIDGTATDLYCQTNTNTDTLVKQTAQASTTTTYPILFSAQSSPTSGTAYEAKYSTSCYVKSNKLYSNGTEVSVAGHTHDYLPSSTTFATINGTSVKSNTAFTLPTLASVYPVGSIYMNASNNTNPATLLGFGTWEQLAPGRVLMGAGNDAYPIGATPGEYEHKLEPSEIPSHNHSVYLDQANTSAVWASYDSDGHVGGGGTNVYSTTTKTGQGCKWDGTDYKRVYSYSQDHGHTVHQSDVGGGGAHNNIQPSLVVYMWVRTA